MSKISDMNYSNFLVDEVKLSFSGLDTDKGLIDVRDLTRGLRLADILGV